MKAAAVYARELGWAIVPLHDVTSGRCSCEPRPDGEPCPNAGKHPRLRKWQEEASNDLDVVAEWIRQYPRANVGIATGALSRFFALDVDPEKGGRETLAALEAEHGRLPQTVQSTTGSGGSHFLFQMPDGMNLRNSAGKLGDGLDTRGDGGQIVVAPSRSSKGAYRWVHAPWDTKIAPAPEWLLKLLSAARTVPSQPGASATERGFFPAASPAVLKAAAIDLDVHGPAIDGQGGGLHTVQAAAILTHDWALTEEEAWPLFVAWNAECVPPWELEGPESLRVMLGRGLKYGKAEFGRARSLDALERAKKLIADWQASGTGESGMVPMIALVREVARHSGDKSRHALIAGLLRDATGLGLRELDLPKVDTTRAVTPTGAIEVTPKLHEVADKAIAAVASKVFARNGVLCEVVPGDRIGRTFIADLETARIQDLMSASAKWIRNDAEKGIVEQAAPLAVATILHARRTHPKTVRKLEAVTTAPVFLADGSILQTRGYNAQARLFLEPSVLVDVANEPTLADAQHAVAVFRDLVCDFEFATPADFASWLAGVLSPLVKSATNNAPAPLICVSASSPGAGKTKLANLISLIVTGAEAEVRPYNPRDVGEWGKRLTSFVKAASPVSLFDNCNGPIGDEGLDRLITSSTWSDRILGASDAPALPCVSTWVATGNNIEPVGDTVRRVLLCRIEVNTERPQERSGFKRADLEGFTLQYRSTYLSAALTILRAFHCAGRPSQLLPSWGSFVTWSELVRDALVWAGCVDPFETQRRASAKFNQPENDAHDFWLDIIASTDGSPAAIAGAANNRDAQTVLGLRESLTPHKLKTFVGRFVDRPRGGRRIREDVEGRRFKVETLT